MGDKELSAGLEALIMKVGDVNVSSDQVSWCSIEMIRSGHP